VWESYALILSATSDKNAIQRRPRERWRPPTQLQPRLPRHLNDLEAHRLTNEAILARTTWLTLNLKRSATEPARTLHKVHVKTWGWGPGEKFPLPGSSEENQTQKAGACYQRCAVIGRCTFTRPEAIAIPPLLLQP
jgi:hypothetical protein